MLWSRVSTPSKDRVHLRNVARLEGRSNAGMRKSGHCDTDSSDSEEGEPYLGDEPPPLIDVFGR